MLIRNYKSSRDLFLKIKRSAEVLSLKESKKIIPLSGKKWQTRNSSSLTSQWKPDLIQLSPPLRKRSWIRRKKELEEVHASALTTLSSPFDCSPFSFDKPHFCPDLSSGEAPASLVDREDTGETTAPISFLQEDQISQPSDVF